MRYLCLSMLMLSSQHMLHAQSVPSVLEKALSAVVTVAIYEADFSKVILGVRGNQETAYSRSLDLSNALSSGSGFVVTMNGELFVVTNAHVVENAKEADSAVYVYSVDQSRYRVRVRGGDSFYDFALLEFIDRPGTEIGALAFSEREVQVGERVYAIGNPLGEYPYSVSDGIISAKNRVRGGPTRKFGFLQSTATVIWGNSGGPLINEGGEVVGMNSQVAFADRGGEQIWQPQINFALEASICRRLATDVIQNNGRIRRPYLGVEICQSKRYVYDLHEDDFKVEILDPRPKLAGVLPDSPGSPLLTGAIGHSIVSINRTEVRNLEEVYGELERVPPGDSVSITFWDAGRSRTLKVPTEELMPGHLAGLANRFATADGALGFSMAGPQASLTIRRESPSVEQLHGTVLEGENMPIIGLGTTARNDRCLWRVLSAADVGAALRLSALNGYCDFVYYQSEQQLKRADASAVRVYLSGEEAVVRSTLWY